MPPSRRPPSHDSRAGLTCCKSQPFPAQQTLKTTRLRTTETQGDRGATTGNKLSSPSSRDWDEEEWVRDRSCRDLHTSKSGQHPGWRAGPQPALLFVSLGANYLLPEVLPEPTSPFPENSRDSKSSGVAVWVRRPSSGTEASSGVWMRAMQCPSPQGWGRGAGLLYLPEQTQLLRQRGKCSSGRCVSHNKGEGATWALHEADL